MSVLESKVHITQGQFIKLIGAIANDRLMTYLEASAASFTDTTTTDILKITCRAFLRVINKQTGFDLDNQEFLDAVNFCVQVGAMTVETKDKINNYIVNQIGANVIEGVVEIKHRWRLPAGVNPSDWFVGVDITLEESVDGYVRVWTTAETSTHPEAVMEV